MPYHLTSHGTPLGQSGAELPGLVPGTRGWHFLPAPDFESVGPLLLELQEATDELQGLTPSAETLAELREEERDAFVRNAIMSDPGSARFLDLMDTVDALGLELHDDQGTLVPTRTLGVTVLDLTPEAFGEVLRSIDPSSDPSLSARPPFYLLVAGMEG